MDFVIDGIKGFSCVNTKTGEEFSLSGGTIELEAWSPYETQEVKVSGTCEATFTCQNAIINEELLSELFLPKRQHTFNLEYSAMVQARRHRKRRINKKWLKKYGYKPVRMNSNGWELSEYNTHTGECEFVKYRR